MVRLFTERVAGAWTAAWAVAPIAVYLLGFELTGLWAALGAAQSGVPGEAFWLQATSGFTPEQARAAIMNVRLAGAEETALTAYAVDAAFMLASFMAAGALIGFGLRRLGLGGGPVALVLIAPVIFLAADAVETALLAVALVFDLESSDALMKAAGLATTAKFPAFAASAVLASR